MILERRQRIEIPDMEERSEGLLQFMQQDNPRNGMKKLAELMHLYNAAMKEVNTKLEALDEELMICRTYNPIHHLECRVKGVASIYKKMKKYGVDVSLDSARESILDIAGIRVICNFVDDIYTVERLLLKQPDITLLNRKDYIVEPKENGYRSLHIIIKVPVYLSSKIEYVPVEIQMRTIAMDYWASLEHMMRYKNSADTQNHSAMLLECANALATTEANMQAIREGIEKE
ncbi:MAG: GTP pyrophosphokinase family protein [Firmicutes bacterium]|nr:GTP pyrophosphokinase family protein [Bacillota bacterium]